MSERTVEERLDDLELGLVELVEALQPKPAAETPGEGLERLHQRLKARLRGEAA